MNTINKNLIKTGFLFFMLQFSVSCTDILDTTSRNILTDDVVWGNDDGITAYIANMYNQVVTEDMAWSSNETYLSQFTDEAVRSYTWGSPNNNPFPDNFWNWWGYGQIRTVNYFLQQMESSTIDADLKARYIAEGRFIRVFHYFALVKRFGGVPLITVPQEYTGDNIAELQVPRNTEKEIYEFIRTELDAITGEGGLPDSWNAANQYRATKWAALALKSRAMLYAASIAKYSTVQINGLVGIPEADANFYWTEAMSAAATVIDSEKYTLYRENDDKAANFQNMFLVKGLHSESIYTKAYTYPGKSHYFDYYNAPQSFKVDYGCVTNPTLQFVEEFEYVDGTPGTLKVNDPDGKPIKYANPYELFNNKDPRLLASVMVPFSPWQGGTLEIRRGIVLPDETKIIASGNYGTGENQISVIGKDGPLNTGDFTKTGFYIKKFMTPTGKTTYSTNDGMVIRYAEVLLNYAEAAMELGQNADKALVYINDIRDRAGIKLHNAIDLEKVRKERRIELAFENHRYWDIIRWRVATTLLNGMRVKALHPYLVWEEGKNPSEMSYIYLIEDAPKEPRTFLEKQYYHNIPADQRSTNPNLVPNPLY
ncbi:MAG: RagB/SusD family nutrient uptake outer membrane protein [Tannerellaceae bacterium]|jgi:hypothetical protein|nr:RagB/SusD family nutrient uptake outer membrane protein [Tannerellaceae bacterium]